MTNREWNSIRVKESKHSSTGNDSTDGERRYEHGRRLYVVRTVERRETRDEIRAAMKNGAHRDE